jgi:hypothetical protein
MHSRTPKFALVALIAVLGCAAPVEPDPEGRNGDRPSAGPTRGGEQEQRRPADQEHPAVTENGIGNHRVGAVSSAAVERDTGLDLSPRPMTDRCSVAFDNRAGVGVVIDTDTLVLAFLITSREHRTYGGVGVGSSVEELRREFGGAMTVLQDPVPGASGPAVEVAPSGGRGGNAHGLHFRTGTDGRVTEYRVGLWPWIGYDEYCLDSSQ